MSWPSLPRAWSRRRSRSSTRPCDAASVTSAAGGVSDKGAAPEGANTDCAAAEGLKMDASTLTRNLRPLVDAGWVVVSAGEDARSRLVSLTPAGREKRAEAKRRWKVAQLGINRLLGEDQVVALHTLIDASMDKLAPVAAGGEGDE